MTPRTRGGLIALAACAALWAAWAARAREVERPPAIQWIALDVSDSAVAPRSGWVQEVRDCLARRARELDGSETRLGLLVFAESARVLLEPVGAEEFSRRLAARGGPSARPLDLRPRDLGGAGSRLDLALGLAERELERAAPRDAALWLIGDGSFTGPGPADGLERLAASGVELHLERLGAADRTDLALVDARLAPALQAGTEGSVRVEVECLAGPEPAEVRFTCEVTRGERSESSESAAPWPQGQRRAAFELDLGPVPEGAFELSVRVSALGRRDGQLVRLPDPSPDDLERRLFGRGGAGPRIALVTSDGRASEAAAALGLGLDGAPEGGLPSWIPVAPDALGAALERVEGVVAYDVPPSSLPAEALDSFVQRGGGLLTLGGTSQLVPEADGGVLDLLPAVAAPLERPARDVLLLVDGSGSMAGEPFEAVRRAALELAKSTPPGDGLGLRFFTAALGPEQRLEGRTAAARAEVAKRLLELGRPSGTTEILDSLEQLAGLRAAGEQRSLLVLLLTDGRENRPPRRDERAVELHAAFEGSATRLVGIAVGERLDLEHLAALSPPGEPVRRVDVPEALRRMLIEEVSAERVARRPQLAGGRTGALTAGTNLLPAVELPALERALLGVARERAEVPWQILDAAGGKPRPLLAVWRRGAGRVASFLGSPAAEWGPDWAGRRDVWGSLLGWIAAGEGIELPVLSWTPDGAALRLSGTASMDAAGLLGRPLERELRDGRAAADLVLRFEPEGPRSLVAAVPEERLEFRTPLGLRLKGAVGQGADLVLFAPARPDPERQRPARRLGGLPEARTGGFRPARPDRGTGGRTSREALVALVLALGLALVALAPSFRAAGSR